jgi:hypothetical protein
VCQVGTFLELLDMLGSIWDPHRYLPVVSDQGPGLIVLREQGPPGLVPPAHFPLCGGSPIKPSLFLRTVQVSHDHYPLQDWKDGAPVRGSIAILHLLQDAALGTLSQQTHHRRRISKPWMNSFVTLATNSPGVNVR